MDLIKIKMEEKELYSLIEKYYGITELQIRSKSRDPEIIKAKHSLMLSYILINNCCHEKGANAVGLKTACTARHYYVQYLNGFPLKAEVDRFLLFVKMNRMKTKMIVINTALFNSEPADILTIEDFQKLIESVK